MAKCPCLQHGPTGPRARGETGACRTWARLPASGTGTTSYNITVEVVLAESGFDSGALGLVALGLILAVAALRLVVTVRPARKIG